MYAEPSGAYVHFITRIAYQYRNSFLHGNEAVPISKIQNDEYNPNIIKFINYLLDDFICSYLIKFMEYIENDENIPKAAKDVAEEIISEKIKKMVEIIKKHKLLLHNQMLQTIKSAYKLHKKPQIFL